jgi:hypothetical protein
VKEKRSRHQSSEKCSLHFPFPYHITRNEPHRGQPSSPQPTSSPGLDNWGWGRSPLHHRPRNTLRRPHMTDVVCCACAERVAYRGDIPYSRFLFPRNQIVCQKKNESHGSDFAFSLFVRRTVWKSFSVWYEDDGEMSLDSPACHVLVHVLD